MRGVILIAFGKRGYGLMTHNLALSLRHYAPDLPIIVWATPELQPYIGMENITAMHTLRPEHWQDSVGGINPAKAKTLIYRLGCEAGMDAMLYLDVDAIALADIRPMLDALKGQPVSCEIVGKGKKGQRIEYLHWASPAAIIEEFNTPPDPTLCGVQTSWVYFERSAVAECFQQHLEWHTLKRFPVHRLLNRWGSAMMPDELYYTGVLAKLGIVPPTPETDRAPIFFGNKGHRKTEAQVTNGYYLLSLYGNENLTVARWQRLYDIIAERMGSKYTTRHIMPDKYANG